MDIVAPFILAFTASTTFLSFVFILATLRDDNTLIDIAWGLAFIVVYGVLFYSLVNNTPRFIVVGSLVCIWGIRLSLHLYLRHRGQPEDFRYHALRTKWGKSVIIRSFFQIFLLQSLLLNLIFSPVIMLTTAPPTVLGIQDVMFIIVWCMGFLIEAVSDYQLQRFRGQRKTAGTVLQSGLWKYSRHPNYFGEAVQWWSIFFLAFMGGAPIYTIIGPLTITVLLLKFSGVTLLEQKYHDNSVYAQYRKRTSTFIPLPPKNV